MWPATHHIYSLLATKQNCTLTKDRFGSDWPTAFSGSANNTRPHSCSMSRQCWPAGLAMHSSLYSFQWSTLSSIPQAHHFEKQSLCNRCVCFQHSWKTESTFSELKYCSDMRDVPLLCCCWSCAVNKCNSWLWWTVVCKYFVKVFFFSSHHKESIHFTYWTFRHFLIHWNGTRSKL